MFITILLCSAVVISARLERVNEEHNPYVEALQQKPWKSIQNYVEVRPGAFMFYWLYYADGTSVDSIKKPLVIWIQGGPGLAASGIANFAEIGPFNLNMKPRNHTWVKGKNLLLFDHPVGTGFSYVTNKTLLVTTDRNAALDLTRGIKAFLRRHKEFRKTPTYLVGQSYGGKLCPRLGYYLNSAIEKKRLKMNLKGLGIGSAWVDPKESCKVYPEYLYVMGLIDQSTYLKTTALTQDLTKYFDKKDFVTAYKFHSLVFEIINKEAGIYINFNHVNQNSPYPVLEELSTNVNDFVKPTLPSVNQSLEWSYFNEDVFNSLHESFLMPSNKFLEVLLNKTKLKIAVYNGNLDVITPLAGAVNWVHQLKWHGAKDFKSAKRIPLRGDRNGFYKSYRQLSLFWILGSGHWIPEDNPAAMHQILDYLTTEEKLPTI